MYEFLTIFVENSYIMSVKLNEIEGTIKELITEIKDVLNLQGAINDDLCPGEMIQSDALVTVTGRLGVRLGINIPLSCYPFFDKKNHKQLTIKEAATKVFNLVKNGK